MAYVGMNVHKKQRQMCLLTEAGARLPQRIPTPWEQRAAVCAERRPASCVRRRPRAHGWQGNAHGLFTGAGQAPPHEVG